MLFARRRFFLFLLPGKQALCRAGLLQYFPYNLQAIDENLGGIVVKVIDPEMQEVIKQIPSEEVIAIALSRSLDRVDMLLHRTKA